MKGKSISDLRDLMVNGSIYITIDTRDFPNGEIRGNSFVGIDRLFPDYTDIQLTIFLILPIYSTKQ